MKTLWLLAGILGFISEVRSEKILAHAHEAPGDEDSAAADPCANPYAFVCNAAPLPPLHSSASVIRAKALLESAQSAHPVGLAQLRVALTKILDSDTGSAEASAVLKDYSAFVNAVQRAVISDYSRNGLNEEQIRLKVESAKGTVIAHLRASTSMHPDQTTLNNEIKLVRSITLITATSLTNSSPESISKFYNTCGIDGLVENAFYDREPNVLVLCPGYLRFVMDHEGLSAIENTVGHEIGHSVDTRSSFDSDRFEKYLGCLKQNFPGLLHSRHAVASFISDTGIPALQRRMKTLAEPTSAQGSQILQAIDSASRAEKNLAFLSDDPVTSHGSELSADYFGIAASVESLRNVTPAQRLKLLKEQMKEYCGEDDYLKLKKIWTQDGDDGVHPPLKFRLENTFRNPELRSLLGCARLRPTDKPWCSLDGAQR